MRIVVTGSNGFVGSWVTRQALARGHRVWAVARPGADLTRTPAEAHLATVETAADLLHVLDEACPHALIHVAWPVPPATYRDDAANEEGLELARAVFETATRTRVPHLVGVGTCLELGDTEAIRTERMPPSPTCRYAATKNAARELGTALAASAGARFTWARLFHLHGPGEAPGRLMRDALDAFRAGKRFDTSPGAQVRDWMHVAAAAEALVVLAESDGDGIAHVCGGARLSLADQLGQLARICGTRDLLHVGARPYGADERMRIVGTSGRLDRIGWRPSFRPLAGLHHTVECYRADRWGTDTLPLPAPRVDFDLTPVREAA